MSHKSYEREKNLYKRKKGEAEIEKGPVDLFPAEPAHDVRGTSALRGPERSEDPTKRFIAEEGT